MDQLQLPPIALNFQGLGMELFTCSATLRQAVEIACHRKACVVFQSRSCNHTSASSSFSVVPSLHSLISRGKIPKLGMVRCDGLRRQEEVGSQERGSCTPSKQWSVLLGRGCCAYGLLTPHLSLCADCGREFGEIPLTRTMLMIKHAASEVAKFPRSQLPLTLICQHWTCCT